MSDKIYRYSDDQKVLPVSLIIFMTALLYFSIDDDFNIVQEYLVIIIPVVVIVIGLYVFMLYSAKYELKDESLLYKFPFSSEKLFNLQKLYGWEYVYSKYTRNIHFFFLDGLKLKIQIDSNDMNQLCHVIKDRYYQKICDNTAEFINTEGIKLKYKKLNIIILIGFCMFIIPFGFNDLLNKNYSAFSVLGFILLILYLIYSIKVRAPFIFKGLFIIKSDGIRYQKNKSELFFRWSDLQEIKRKKNHEIKYFRFSNNDSTIDVYTKLFIPRIGVTEYISDKIKEYQSS